MRLQTTQDDLSCSAHVLALLPTDAGDHPAQLPASSVRIGVERLFCRDTPILVENGN